ncbi:hypothetical protein [Caldimonas brevitalea]|uniref:Uncharacterized protein n=1 Tax=Caldimonas brevitalea TaxID=413882 RepID=A0A0G3BUV2_9BURK|nr:hypothetical protein [Caldimonas brevitalea]AKJ30280.1 hypothetical protein AAW51_3589 [Caldimonas brevitalea]
MSQSPNATGSKDRQHHRGNYAVGGDHARCSWQSRCTAVEYSVLAHRRHGPSWATGAMRVQAPRDPSWHAQLYTGVNIKGMKDRRDRHKEELERMVAR